MMFVRSMKSGVAPLVGIVALCAIAGSAKAQVGVQYTLQDGAPGQLATLPLYPPGMADDVRRPGFNGRLWISRPIIGGVDTGYPTAWRDPGPASYGAPDDVNPTVYARIGNTAATIPAFEYVQGSGLKCLESARSAWLAEHGFTGGVRTFVNDLYLYAPQGVETAQASSAGHEIQPRATIHTAPDQPRFKARMQVRNSRASGAAAIALLGDGAPLNISWPQSAPNRDASLIRVIVPDTAVAATKPASDTTETPDTQGQANATPVASAER